MKKTITNLLKSEIKGRYFVFKFYKREKLLRIEIFNKASFYRDQIEIEGETLTEIIRDLKIKELGL